MEEKNDDAGNAQHVFIIRGGRMLNEETYGNLWELLSDIPSIDSPGQSVAEEILNFDHRHPTHAKARLVDKEGNIMDVTKMGFSQEDCLALGKLMITNESELDDLKIEDWFSPHFLKRTFGICGKRLLPFKSGQACLS